MGGVTVSPGVQVATPIRIKALVSERTILDGTGSGLELPVCVATDAT